MLYVKPHKIIKLKFTKQILSHKWIPRLPRKLIRVYQVWIS